MKQIKEHNSEDEQEHNLEDEQEHNLEDEQKNVEQIMDLTTSITGDIFNIFLDYYKKNKKLNTYDIFNGIDYNDITSTNKIMELLYQHLIIYKEEDEDFIKVIPYKISNNSDIIKNLYCIKKNKKPLLVSKSLFSIMLEFREMKKYLGNEANIEIINL